MNLSSSVISAQKKSADRIVWKGTMIASAPCGVDSAVRRKVVWE